jgi:hypothetical protein
VGDHAVFAAGPGNVMSLHHIGKGGFQGSPIAEWCPTCRDYMVPLASGICGWCSELPVPSLEERKADRLQERADRDEEIMRYRRQGMSSRDIAKVMGRHDRGVRAHLARLEQVAA